MALVTVQIAYAAGGAFVASYTYDETTRVLQSIRTVLLRGSATLTYGNHTIPVPPGDNTTDVSAFNFKIPTEHQKPLQTIKFTWSSV